MRERKIKIKKEREREKGEYGNVLVVLVLSFFFQSSLCSTWYSEGRGRERQGIHQKTFSQKKTALKCFFAAIYLYRSRRSSPCLQGSR